MKPFLCRTKFIRISCLKLVDTTFAVALSYLRSDLQFCCTRGIYITKYRLSQRDPVGQAPVPVEFAWSRSQKRHRWILFPHTTLKAYDMPNAVFQTVPVSLFRIRTSLVEEGARKQSGHLFACPARTVTVARRLPLRYRNTQIVARRYSKRRLHKKKYKTYG